MGRKGRIMAIDGMLAMCGLTLEEASTFLGEPPRRLRRWRARDSNPPLSTLDKLSALYKRQVEAADVIVEAWFKAGAPDEITIEMPSTDEEAQARGWPCLRTVDVVAMHVQLEISPARLKIIAPAEHAEIEETAPEADDASEAAA